MAYNLNVNGKALSADVDGDTPLLWVLRDTLGLVGTKYGCGVAACGACTVHVDGQAMRSCQIEYSASGRPNATRVLTRRHSSSSATSAMPMLRMQ